MDASSLVGILNDIFSLWDRSAEEYGLEKIKTIGDCYMAAAGVPTACADHAHRVARMGIAMQKDLADYRVETGQEVHVRVGIHSGEVVAGVIGSKKFV